MVEALLGHGEADQAASMLGHEVDGFGRDLLGGERDVAFVLAVLVVDDDDHAAGADLLDGSGNVGKGLGAHDDCIVANLVYKLVNKYLVSSAQYLVSSREVQHRQQLLMEFFPRDGHGFASLQVLHTARYFFVPSGLNRFVPVNLWVHGFILTSIPFSKDHLGGRQGAGLGGG